MANKNSVTISLKIIEMVGGGTGMEAIIRGLRDIKAWCDEYTPGYAYSRRATRFDFASAADRDKFNERFADALALKDQQ